MPSKTPGLDHALHAYLVDHATPRDAVLADLDAETRREFGDAAGMLIAPEQGQFLTMLTRLLGVRTAVEVGTFTGYSSICIARGLAPGGRLTCIDVSEEFTAVARRYWHRAGVGDRIDLRLQDGVDGVRSLPDEPHIDLAFIDAHKPQYIDYYEALLPRLTERGVLIADNVLWGGKVVDSDGHEFTRALQAFNEHVREDPRSEVVMLPIADGLSFITRRP